MILDPKTLSVIAIIAGFVIFAWYISAKTNIEEGFMASTQSKCYSCEAQDAAMGIYREYGTKCFSCER
jgi:hypothetical protein